MTTKKGIDWAALSAPFADYKWKVQTANEWGCQCVAYIDARHVMNRLDEVVGPENWQVEYMTVSGLLFARIGISVDGEWVWKGDTGSESNIEKDKGHVSDAFKRAAVHWGIGRHLYELPIMKVKAVQDKRSKWQPADDSGNRLYSNDQLTTFINGKLKKGGNGQSNANKPSRKDTAPKKDTTPELNSKVHKEHGSAEWKNANAAMWAAAGEEGIDEQELDWYLADQLRVSTVKALPVKMLKAVREKIKDGSVSKRLKANRGAA